MKTYHIILFGIGNVGSTLINQINEANKGLRSQGRQIKIPVVANSKLVFCKDDVLSKTWQSDFDTFSVPYKINEVISFINKKGYKDV
ncbi:MAG: aspartate kinase, partial [Psychroserpens sp.]|nr:aspartate kinase [Psychroserpens sp.]